MYFLEKYIDWDKLIDDCNKIIDKPWCNTPEETVELYEVYTHGEKYLPSLEGSTNEKVRIFLDKMETIKVLNLLHNPTYNEMSWK